MKLIKLIRSKREANRVVRASRATTGRTVHLSFDEVSTLLSVIEFYLEGLDEAETPTIDDPTIETADQLLDLMSDIQRQRIQLTEVRRKILND